METLLELSASQPVLELRASLPGYRISTIYSFLSQFLRRRAHLSRIISGKGTKKLAFGTDVSLQIRWCEVLMNPEKAIYYELPLFPWPRYISLFVIFVGIDKSWNEGSSKRRGAHLSHKHAHSYSALTFGEKK